MAQQTIKTRYQVVEELHDEARLKDPAVYNGRAKVRLKVGLKVGLKVCLKVSVKVNLRQTTRRTGMKDKVEGLEMKDNI